MITLIDPSSFTLYEQHSDAMASQFMADYAREGGADAYTKARGEAMAATRSATKSAQAGTAAQMAAMGLNPSSGRYQSAMQDIAMKGALGEVGATQNAQTQQDARRYTAAQAAQQGTMNAAKLKGDIWSLQNQQSDVENKYGVGMAGAAASMASANASMVGANAAMKNADNNFTLGQDRLKLDDKLGVGKLANDTYGHDINMYSAINGRIGAMTAADKRTFTTPADYAALGIGSTAAMMNKIDPFGLGKTPAATTPTSSAPTKPPIDGDFVYPKD